MSRALLVDTHVALWALGDPARLRAGERALLVDPSIDRCLSPRSIWEAAIKRRAGRLVAPRNLATGDGGGVSHARNHCAPARSGRRIATLIAHALQDDLSVPSRDAVFADYGVRLATATI